MNRSVQLLQAEGSIPSNLSTWWLPQLNAGEGVGGNPQGDVRTSGTEEDRHGDCQSATSRHTGGTRAGDSRVGHDGEGEGADRIGEGSDVGGDHVDEEGGEAGSNDPQRGSSPNIEHTIGQIDFLLANEAPFVMGKVIEKRFKLSVGEPEIKVHWITPSFTNVRDNASAYTIENIWQRYVGS